MELSDFSEEFMSEVGARAMASGAFLEEAFFELASAIIIDVGEISEVEHAHYAGRGVRVDGYAGDPINNQGQLTLLLLDFENSKNLETLTNSDLVKIFKRGTEFVSRALDGRLARSVDETDPVFALGDMIKMRWGDIVRVKFVLLSNQVLSQRVDSLPSSDLAGVPTSISVWDIGRISRQALSARSTETIDVDLLDEFGSRIPVLPADVGADGYKAFLAVVKGPLLAAIYDRFGARLLEQNVRVFLQARGKVNRAIRDTIAKEPQMFFAFNNGITATAEDVRLETDKGGVWIRGIRNLQIVNGGQTTASIHQALLRKDSLDEVHVQMKLSVIPSDRVDQVVPRISEYANSQNRVSAIDFFANHPFHIRVEEMSRRILAPQEDGAVHQTHWFYERARGQYQNQKALARTPSGRKEFDLKNPRHQRFDKGELAKFLMPWEGLPHFVARGSQKNFTEFAKRIDKIWKDDSDKFNDLWFRHAAARAIIFRMTERLVSAQSWYEGGGSRAKIVPYGIYALQRYVRERERSIDLDKVWASQSVSDEFIEAMTRAITLANEAIYLDSAEKANRNEYAKMEICRDRLVAKLGNFPPLDNFTISLERKTEVLKDAKVQRKITSGIEDQTHVLKAGADFWKSVALWGLENKQLTEKDKGILNVACAIPKKLPSEKQATHLVALVERLKKKGGVFTQI